MTDHDPYHGLPIVKAMREQGFETVYLSPDLLHGHGSATHATVLLGGMPIGTAELSGGEWEFTPGDPNLPYVTTRPVRRGPETRVPEPAVAFYATCTAFQHADGNTSGVWYGPLRDTYEEARNDAGAHEHAEAYVGQTRT
ncbi:hypothetical protein [Jiangella muralis]|uniref:hypothetical protein n=1 Tax=Jiangella muralis TaxID=702383 RepID=UPI00069D3003|nr:hypothetical protein [Jiangella muralis]